MNPPRIPFLFAIVVCLLSGSFTQAADPQPSSITIKQFAQLTPSEQRALLVKTFQRRLEHAKNLYYEVNINWLIYENQNELPGKLREPLMSRQCRHWQLGDSYRLEWDMFRPEEKEACEWVFRSYDASNGITRSIFKNQQRAQGRIDREQCNYIRDNAFIFWLRGSSPHKAQYLFQYLIDHKAEFEIEAPVADGKVRLTVDFQPYWTTRPGGKRIFLLDPEKGFLPVDGHSRWQEIRVDGNQSLWRVERFMVTETKRVGDVWMPVKLTEEIMGSSAPEIISTSEVEVTHIEHGKVKPKDLEIEFPPGMKILDAIKEETYTVTTNKQSE